MTSPQTKPVIPGFSQRARTVLGAAHLQACRLQHDEIRPEHLLLALVQDQEAVATKVLSGRCGVDTRIVTKEIESRLRRGKNAAAEITKSADVRSVIGHALDEAARFGHTYIGTEHLLLGLLREGGETPAQVLSGAGVTLEIARAAVAEYLKAYKSGDPRS